MTRSAAVGLGVMLLFGTATLATADVKAGAKDVSVTGEVIDTFCYGTVGAKGTSHKQCGIDCAKKGIRVGLREKGSEQLHILLPTNDKTALPDQVINEMGGRVTVT